jgi:hypothetical protein
MSRAASGLPVHAVVLRLRTAVSRAARHRFGLQLAGVTLLLGSSLVAVGDAGRERAALHQAESARIEAVATALDLWEASFQPPVPGEAAAWRESEAILRGFAPPRVHPLALANLLAGRGEEVVRGEVRIRLARADTVYVPPAVALGPAVLATGGSAFSLEVEGGWSSIVGLLGSLPPQVEVAGVQLSSSDRRVRAGMLVLSRELLEP